MKKPSVPNKAPLPDPAKDGIDHINVHYNAASTDPLGRQLSTFQSARFEHPYFGPFKSIEGFLLYVKTGCMDDEFRTMNGTEATNYYRDQIDRGNLRLYKVANLGDVLLSAYVAMLKSNPVIAKRFTESTLPFDNYFLYRKSNHPIRPKDSAELTHTLTVLRDLMKAGEEPRALSHEEYAKLVVRD